MVDEQFGEFGYFHQQSGDRKAAQIGIYRTNCLNCLDRTNLAQTIIAQQVVKTWLEMNGLRPLIEPVLTMMEEEWVNTAHAIARLNGGTDAVGNVKGGMTLRGRIDDLVSRTKRRYMGSFVDT